MKKIQVQLNPYLEYINSILLTGKYNEITTPVVGYGLMNEEENEYTTAIRSYLEPYKEHPVYTFIEEMIPQGFTFARPVELALSMGEGKDFSMQYRVSEFCVECCGGIPKVEELLRLLKEFDREADYYTFYNREKSFYDSYLEKARLVAEAYPYVALLEKEFGKEQNSYRLILSSLMKGNFGIVFEDEEALERLKPCKLPGFQSGYGDWKECVNEHLVRAMVIHLLRRCDLHKEAEEQLSCDLGLGYKYIPMLLESYEYYDRNRKSYLDFESYYPEVLKVFAKDFETVV